MMASKAPTFSPDDIYHSELMVDVETITPDVAEAYLAYSRNPRRLRPSVTGRYAADMVAGNWAPGSGCICFDVEGRLRDGQHRLQACVDSGAAFTTLVARNVPEEAVDNIDRGFKRSIGDVLKGHGEQNVSHLQAAITTCWKWDRGLISGSVGPTASESMAWLEDNPGIREAVNVVQPIVHRPLRIRISVAAPFAYRTSLIDPEGSAEFLRLLISGAGLEFQNPILRLRDAVMNRKPGVQMRRDLELALMIKSWNAWAQGIPVRNLRWSLGGPHPEVFPLLVDGEGEIYPFPEMMGEEK